MAKGALEGSRHPLPRSMHQRLDLIVLRQDLRTPFSGKLTSNEKVREASEKKHPLGRIGNPKDIAAMASFLLNDRSSWMTGQILRVDGGMSSIRK